MGDEPKKKPERFSIPLPEEAPATPAPQEEPKPPKPITVGGFAENTLNDAFDFLKGLYQIIPSTIKSYQENVPKIFSKESLEILKQNPGLLWDATKDTGIGMGKAIAEPYTKHGARVLYERPLTVAADAITLITLGGSAIANTGKLAKASGMGARADELIRAGRALQELPGKMARQIVDSSVLKASGGKWNLAKRREVLTIKREEQARKAYMIEKDIEGVGRAVGALNNDEAAVFDRFIRFGATKADLDANPKVGQAFLAYKELAEKTWQPGILSRRFKNQGELDEALAKKYALEAWDDVSPESVARARQAIAQAEIKPVYAPHIPIDKLNAAKATDLIDDLVSGGKRVREGKVGSLESFKGTAAGYVKDPRKYVPKAIYAFRDLEAKTRFSERLMQSKELIAGSGAGLTPDAVPEGIFRKYYEDSVRAQALKSVKDPTVQRLLKWEYISTQHGLIRLYDRVMRLFSISATRWNPKWQTGNVVGDAVLGTLAGSSWGRGKQARLADALPYEAVAKGGAGSLTDIEKLARKPTWADSALEIGEAADKAARAGIISFETARKLERVGYKFEASANTLDDVLRSTRDFSDVQVQLQLLEENIARNTPIVLAKTKKVTKLEKMEAALHERLMAQDVRAQAGAVSKAEGLKASDVQSDISVLKETQRRVQSLTNAERLVKERIRDAAKAIDQESAKRLRGPTPIKKDFPEHLGARKADLEGKLLEVQESLEYYRVLRNLQRGQIRRKLAKPAKSQDAVLGGFIEKSFREAADQLDTIRQKIVNLETETRAIIRDITDDMVKKGALDARIPDLKQQVDIVRGGVERANAFIGDYLGLDGFEQGVIKRLIPFYPWAKAMTMLSFRIPFLAPVKAMLWHRLSEFMVKLAEDPEMPEWMRGRVPVFSLKDGRQVWVNVSTYSPFGSLRASKAANMPVPQVANIVERNPMIGLAFRFFGGKTEFDPTGIPYGEQMVSLHDGSVVEFTNDGMLKKVIPQTPLVQGVAHMFPTVQLVEQILTPYWTNKYNWAGLPQPVLNPDGTYRYPRELWDRLSAAVGVSVMTRSSDDLKRGERRKVYSAIRELEGMYKRSSDPEEREMIREVMRDYVSGNKYRKFKAG